MIHRRPFASPFGDHAKRGLATVIAALLATAPAGAFARSDHPLAPGAPPFASVQHWLADQAFMKCKTTLSNEIGASFGLPAFLFPSGFNSVTAHPIPELLFRSPPLRTPSYLLKSLLRYDMGKAAPQPFALYLAYDPEVKAAVYYLVGNEFESIGYFSSITEPPTGTPRTMVLETLQATSKWLYIRRTQLYGLILVALCYRRDRRGIGSAKKSRPYTLSPETSTRGIPVTAALPCGTRMAIGRS